ncbi:IS110 family transposase [Wolbachia pipientis]|uniref:IS110 family transposase n=2 Tax=Wolbachia TaxID=953 RepID=A0A6C1U1K9_WOLPI|nr:IS110 family transposase [Wolbachia pipientis]
MVENLKTIKGIGYLTAVVAEMPSVDNFDNAKQFTAFAARTLSIGIVREVAYAK